ncbi:unnamed protein product [Phytophthora fragariaefolia]|uniref:Unnamed protein product n=1 Tax=Phytophthora fragariaefolia TaxID=1490495 RepID=A0A9W7DA15_9STRA|nr:unnamed protein product [Phytophthora fragariaefolia]
MKIFAAAAIAACALTATNVAADGSSWGYKANDTSMAAPDKWAEHYPTCGGQRQSPIDLETSLGCISEKRSLTFNGSCADFNVSQSDESFTASVNGGERQRRLVRHAAVPHAHAVGAHSERRALGRRGALRAQQCE